MNKFIQNLLLAFLIPTGMTACWGGNNSSVASKEEVDRYLADQELKAEDYAGGLLLLIGEPQFDQSHVKILNYILRNTAIDVTAPNSDNIIPLHYAAWEGNLEVVNALLKVDGIKVNAKDIYNSTPLHLAVENEHLEIVNTLLRANGIDVNVQNRNGTTALALAEEKGLTDIANAIRQAQNP